MFYVVCRSLEERTALINYLKEKDILAVFHYLSLHKSEYYLNKYNGEELDNCDHFADCLLRLPLFYELDFSNLKYITESIKSFYEA